MHTVNDHNLPTVPVRVLHLTISFARGGRRDAIVSLAKAGRRHNLTPFLVTLRGSPTDVEPFAAEFDGHAQLDLHGLPSMRQIHALRDNCRNWGVQVVHAHDASSQFVASALRLVAPSLRVVMTFHRSLGFESAGAVNRLRNAVSLPLVHRVLTASEERRRHFLSENFVSRRKVTTIPLGIDLERFRPDPRAREQVRLELGLAPGELLLASAGHFGEEKGIDVALAATSAARERRPDVPFRLAVMGTGTPERQATLHALGQQLLGDRVLFLGQRSDPERIFAAADLVVHAPRLEAFGLVVVQAMASGAPVVAAAVGGIPEIIVDGTTGVLFPVADADAAGERIAALIGDPEGRERLGRAALELARREYPADRFAGRHAQLYRELLGAD
jgi:glycosyltransferase involved in cell wall biosynthesis